MRTLLRYSAFFIIAFVAIALCLDQWMAKKIIFRDPNSNQSKMLRLVSSTDPLEIPIFGSSKARSAFIPDTLGPTVFNYGMDKCNYDVIEFELAHELAKPSTAPIIIEFNHRFFIHEPEHTIDAATFVPIIDKPGVRDYLKKNGRDELRWSIPGVRYYGSILTFIRSASRKETGQRKHISKGGLFIDNPASPRVLKSQVDARDNEIAEQHDLLFRKTHVEEAISAQGLARLQGLDALLLFSEPKDRIELFEAQLAQRPDRPILIVYTPQHPSELKGMANYDRVLAKFKEWETRFPNVHVYNYSHVRLPDTDFKNIAHLNTAGARVLSGMLKHDAQQYLSNP